MNFSLLQNRQPPTTASPPQRVVKYKEHRFQSALHIVVQRFLPRFLRFIFIVRIERKSRKKNETKKDSDSEIIAFFTVFFL